MSRPELHPLLAGRWSPTSFDPNYEATTDQVDLILEAARWAPSAGNSQPWAFLGGRRGDPLHARLVPYLRGSSKTWATTASILIANLRHRFVEDTDWEYSEFSAYDLGQAVAHMTIQAHSLGLFARQFRAFDRDGLEREFAVPAHWEITTMTAFGQVPAGTPMPGNGGPINGFTPAEDTPIRQRRPADELRWPCTTDSIQFLSRGFNS